jgi:citronellol/citronellal dehydrogenase
LRKAENPHVLALSPPLDLKPQWFAGHVAYAIAKYGMSLAVLGLAEELMGDGIAVNALCRARRSPPQRSAMCSTARPSCA